jgi:molecular chaperone GrpE (heat shock protein)
LVGQVADEGKKAADAGLLEQTIIKLEGENKELKERVLRALAEVENMRLRCTPCCSVLCCHFTFRILM